MFELAKSYHLNSQLLKLDVFTAIEDFNLQKNLRLIECILRGQLIMIAYDCDFNFEPCLKNGKKAHWALVHGFFYSLPFECLDKEHNLTHFNSNCYKLNKNDDFKHCFDRIDFEKFYVFAKHGKSKHSAIWSLKHLLLSNFQLNEVDDKFLNSKEFILPANGIFETLSCRYIVFQ